MSTNNIIQFPKKAMEQPESVIIKRNEELKPNNPQRKHIIDSIIGPHFKGLTQILYDNGFSFKDEENFKTYIIMCDLLISVIYEQEDIDQDLASVAHKLAEVFNSGKKFIIESSKE